MARRRGEQQTGCSVVGCDREAVRSLSRRKVVAALSDIEVAEGRRAPLCKDHYKRFKKATKVERTIDRLTW
ncbi:MAG: hypothetical protein ACE5HJ_07985 [Thermoplasmata archaeon]